MIQFECGEKERDEKMECLEWRQSTKECADKQKYLFLSHPIHTIFFLYTERRFFRVYLIMKQHFFSVLMVLELASWGLDGFSS